VQQKISGTFRESGWGNGWLTAFAGISSRYGCLGHAMLAAEASVFADPPFPVAWGSLSRYQRREE
jgi:hypothetical protein